MVEVIQGIKMPYGGISILFGELEFRFGMFYNIYGRQKTGKTAICFYISNELIKKGFNVIYVETEKRITSYEAVSSKLYQNNFQKLYTSPIPLFEFINNEPSFDKFINYLECLIVEKKINAIIIDSITHPLKNIHPKISGKIVTRFFNYFYDEIVLKHNILGIIVSHSWVEYDSGAKTQQEIPRGSRQSRYIPNKTLQTIMEENGDYKSYSLNFHTFKVDFIINLDGTIDKIG